MMFCVRKINACIKKNHGEKILDALDYIITDLKYTGKMVWLRLMVMMVLAAVIAGAYQGERFSLTDAYIALGILSIMFLSSLMKLSHVKRIKSITIIYLDDVSILLNDSTLDEATLRLRIDSLTRVYSNELEAINNIDVSTLLDAAFNKNKHDLHLILS